MLETFIGRNNFKVVVNLEELKRSKRLKGAVVFNKIFNLLESNYKKTDFPRNSDGDVILFKIYNITCNEWLSFIKFIRYGMTKYDIIYSNIANIKLLKNYKKLFFQHLDDMTESGVFIKFGPFPEFHNYIESNIKQIKKLETLLYNPMSPEEDSKKLFLWSIGYNYPVNINVSLDNTIPENSSVEETQNKIQDIEFWSVTKPTGTGKFYWKKLKAQSN